MRPALLALVACLAACGGGPAARDPADRAAIISYGMVRTHVRDSLTRRLRREQKDALDVLVISTGGSRGAFAAGVLNGWRQLPADDPQAMPVFDLVTGVSTGALVGAFALAGDRESLQRCERHYLSCEKAWAQRKWFAAALDRESLYDNSRYLAAMEAAFDRELVAALARARAEERLLVVRTMDLELGRPRLWELTSLAQRGRPDLVRKVIEATTALPIVFPPVRIDGGLHVDGGVGSQLLVDLPGLTGRPPQGLRRVRCWVILNYAQHPEAVDLERRWRAIGDRALVSAVHAGVRGPLRELAWWAAGSGLEVELRVLAIPDGSAGVGAHPFDPVAARQLAELGRRLGRDPASWQRLSTTAAEPLGLGR